MLRKTGGMGAGLAVGNDICNETRPARRQARRPPEVSVSVTQEPGLQYQGASAPAASDTAPHQNRTNRTKNNQQGRKSSNFHDLVSQENIKRNKKMASASFSLPNSQSRAFTLRNLFCIQNLSCDG